MNKPVSPPPPPQRRGALDQQGRRRAPVPVGEICRRPVRARRHASCSCTARRWPRSRPSTCRCPAVRIPPPWISSPRCGFDTWCVDMEGYGRSTKTRDNNAPISQGADDCFAAATYIQKLRGKKPFLVYGISSGALRAALFARAPSRDWSAGSRSTPWCGPAKARRRSPTAASGCRNTSRRTAARSTAPSCTRSSPATIPAPPTTT